VGQHLLGGAYGRVRFSRGGSRTSPNPPPSTPVEQTGNRSQIHDLGLILASGQSIKHVFVLKNSSDKEVHVLRGVALTPCCSSIESLPESLPPGGEGQAVVAFQPGYQSGPKGVEFTVETDARPDGIWELGLRASLTAAWEVAPQADFDSALRVGEAGKQVFRVVARRKGVDGFELPQAASASSPLSIRYPEGEATTKNVDEVIEQSQECVVEMPATNRPGSYSGHVSFRWPDGHMELRSINWEVRSALRVSPPVVVLTPAEKPIRKKVVITSEAGPFTVKSVQSPLLADKVDVPSRASSRFEFELSLLPPREAPDHPAEVLFVTDCPSQANASLKAIILGRTPTGRRR